MSAARFLDVDPAEYHSDSTGPICLSQSIAHTLVSKSELHAWMQHPRLGGVGREPSKEMDLGSVCHAILLGKGKQFAVVQAPDGEPEFRDYKTKAAKEARDAVRAEGKIPLLQKHLDAACTIVEAVRPQLKALGIALNGESELAVYWEESADDGTIVPCRCMLDHWDRPIVYDLKFVGSSHPRACQSHLVSFGGDMQASAYLRAIESVFPELMGRTEFRFLFCEVTPPYCVTPVVRAGSMRELGDRRWRRAVNRWARCIATDHWSGYVESITAIEAPAWAMFAESDSQLTDSSTRESAPDGPSSGESCQVPGDTENGTATGARSIEELDGIF